MERSQKIIILVDTLTQGGAQKVAADLSRYLGGGIDPTIVLYSSRIDYPYRGTVISLGHRQCAHPVLKIADILRRLVLFVGILIRVRPRVIVSFMGGPNVIAICAAAILRACGVPTKTVICEHSVPGHAHARGDFVNRLHRVSMRLFYAHANRVIAVSDGVREELTRQYAVPARNIEVVPNPIDIERVQQQAGLSISHPAFSSHEPVIVTMGRLSPEKGHRFLIEAFATLTQQVPARLVIVGEGELRQELRAQAAAQGVAERVYFTGFVPNPYSYLRQSHVFVLSSLWESFSLAILEAMACGVPVIAADCPYGPREILAPGVPTGADITSYPYDADAGILVRPRDTVTLERALRELLNDPARCQAYREQGFMRIREYDINRIAQRYTQLLIA